MSYVHLVVKPYDPSMDYEAICKRLFKSNKCLVMMEKKGGDHCHIQGMMETDMSNEQWRNEIAALAAMHYRRKQDPSSRPVKRRKTEADEVGFQYMAKELPSSVVVFKQGFEDGELEELYERSNEHRDELKAKLGEHLLSRIVRGSCESPRDLHKRMCSAALCYYMDQDKMCPPNIKLLVRHFMLKQYGGSSDVLSYLSELIM